MTPLTPLRSAAFQVLKLPQFTPVQARKRTRVILSDFGGEPFRAFFPIALLAGMIGVSLWPLYFTHVTSFYPGIGHARIMALGFFGGFIFGFLGTALPRMLSAERFSLREVASLLLVHVAMVVAFATGRILAGDLLCCLLIVTFVFCASKRAIRRKDLPPPGFVLVVLSLACVAVGAVIAVFDGLREIDPRWVNFERLLMYQGFVLLPVLGIGPFLLPRFFGLPTPEFPEASAPGRAWLWKAALALGFGLLVMASFAVEAFGWYRTGYGLRFAVTGGYFLLEMPLHRAPARKNAVGLSIRISLVAIVTGFLAVSLFPAYRVALLHLSLIGGFAVITMAVATRVIFGHSGNIDLLKRPNRWMQVSVGMMLLAMATRISGDFWPKVMASHYSYGAILWIGAALLWGVFVLPKVLLADTSG